MRPFVLDASVVAKLAIEEHGSAEFRAWFLENAGEDFQAPTLLFSEVGRVIQKHLLPSSARQRHALHAASLDSVRLVPPTATDGRELWPHATDLSFYDAEYVRLAQRLGGVLVTADHRMAEHARKRGVQVKEF